MIGIMMIVLLCFGAAIAQEKTERQESGFTAWLKNIRQKLDIVSPRKTLTVTTGVAGVRGARRDEKARLYWKGKPCEEQVSEAELSGLRTAVDLAEKGEHTAAIRELEEFMARFPDSALVPDAKRTLDLAKAEMK
jgi:TolA-binding protein